MGICFPYLGEFQPTKYREKILCWMEMFWTFGIIILPGNFKILFINHFAINKMGLCSAKFLRNFINQNHLILLQ